MLVIELFVLGALWGASFLFMRVAVPQLGAVPLIAMRVGLAALVLAPVLRSAAVRQALRQRWRSLLVVGASNSAIPFTLFADASQTLGAGLDSVLNATTPLWAGLILVVGFGGRLRRAQLGGLLLGFIGVAVLVQGSIAGVHGAATAVVEALLAAFCYGFAVNYSRLHLVGVPPYALAFGTQLAATLLLAPVVMLQWPQHWPSPSTWGAVLAFAVLCTALAFVLYFHLIAEAGAAYAASVTYLIPVFGVLWSVIFLDEPLTPAMLLGGAIVLLGSAVHSVGLRRDSISGVQKVESGHQQK